MPRAFLMLWCLKNKFPVSFLSACLPVKTCAVSQLPCCGFSADPVYSPNWSSDLVLTATGAETFNRPTVRRSSRGRLRRIGGVHTSSGSVGARFASLSSRKPSIQRR